jgi:tetrahydromethanopterin S-methyltransferase subunit E
VNGGYGAAATLCPLLMLLLACIFLPVLWPLLVLSVLVGVITVGYVALTTRRH